MVRKNPGFTIVELLIVIVVIAILAAISIVAYTGIQNKANDAAVQADIRNLGNLIEQYNVTEGSYPIADTNAELYEIFASFNVSLSLSSYETPPPPGGANFLYIATPDASGFALVARAKSGTNYYWSSRSQGVAVFEGAYAEQGRTWTRNQLLDDNSPLGAGESIWGYGNGTWAMEFR